jgi:methionyl-tRNA formyltransferase
MRVVFMGTPEFALPSLGGLVEAGDEIALVVSQPDRPAGRGRRLAPPPVAAFARERGLPLFQPASLKPPEAFARVRDARPDVVVVVAFGLLLRREVLDLPPLGCLNVHASLLPRWRGAAPIPAAILAGDGETGVCLMRMEAGLDTGPILACAPTPIAPEDDTPTLTDRLALMGRDLLLETLPRWAAGAVAPRPQDDGQATYARRISREDARLDWSLSAIELWRRVRAYRGWPDAFTTWSGRQLKVLAAEPAPPGASIAPDLPPGHVVLTELGGVRVTAVTTGDGTLVLRTVALAGRGSTDAADFVRGHRDFIGATLE